MVSSQFPLVEVFLLRLSCGSKISCLSACHEGIWGRGGTA
jgi:hypothetical protein